MILQVQLWLFNLFLCWTLEIKPKLTIDEFFNSTNFLSLSFSPSGQYLLYQTIRPAWNNSSYEYSLWLYEIDTEKKKFITKNLGEDLKAHWSSNGHSIAFLLKNYLYLYSILSNELSSMEINIENPSMLRWGDNDTSLYMTTVSSQSIEKVIPYRQRINNVSSTIHRIDIHNRTWPIEIHMIANLPFLIGELFYVPFEEKLVFTSTSTLFEDIDQFEIYMIDLRNSSSLSRLTYNQEFEIDLQLSIDGKHVLFRNYTRRSNQPDFNDTQYRLYSLDLENGQIERLGRDFMGNIIGYKIKSDGGVFILGQLGTEIQIYIQQSSREISIHLQGWNGSYERVASSINRPHSIAFVYSSFEKPKEIYFVQDIEKIQLAQVITNENDLLTQRNIPKAKVYQWKNEQDNRIIEGILHYPPGRFEAKNLSLLVLMHGGPYDASRNDFQADWYSWAPLAATHGWLVLEPNYCGSTGYGDDFLNEIRYQPLTRPGRDILLGIDQLIQDGIVDPNKLALGGYSYGGFLTNWLITQTTRFNAALSGAGAVDHTSSWGTMDLPLIYHQLFGGQPWDKSHIYLTESPIYQLHKVRTPTHIVTGEKDVRVVATQSYMLERGLYYLGIPVKLIILPTEGHELENNPWHGKIKVREELKWLEKYGHQSCIIDRRNEH